MSPVELSAYVLDALRNDAERVLETSVTRCVVTVPAYFSEAQRSATRDAARMAGFVVERVLNEPTAAAIAYGLHRKEDERQFLVFDLGGGTFDVCVMELFEGTLQVQSVAGESDLGGEDFTEALMRLAFERLDLDYELLRRDPAIETTLRRRCELLKRKLGRWPSATLELPPWPGHLTEATTLEFRKDEAERAYAPLLNRLVGPCRSALRGANITANDLDEVVLVGGATRMPCVQAFVRDFFGREPLVDPDPDRIVVRGAAIQAAMIARDSGVEDMVVTDVASHSLGVEVTRDIGGQFVDGYFSPLIHRNTVIPTAKTGSFQTLHANQKVLRLRIFEGEGRKVEDNTLIGEVEVKDIPPGPAGQSVDVTFTFDLDGMLGVHAQIQSTKKSFEAMFNRSGETLDPERMEAARERFLQLRSGPEQRPRYRDLLARADLLWREVDAELRPVLEVYIHQFEEALTTRDAAVMNECFAELSEFCDRIDDGERW